MHSYYLTHSPNKAGHSFDCIYDNHDTEKHMLTSVICSIRNGFGGKRSQTNDTLFFLIFTKVLISQVPGKSLIIFLLDRSKEGQKANRREKVCFLYR